jgi:hypothetical protein
MRAAGSADLALVMLVDRQELEPEPDDARPVAELGRVLLRLFSRGRGGAAELARDEWGLAAALGGGRTRRHRFIRSRIASPGRALIQRAT